MKRRSIGVLCGLFIWVVLPLAASAATTEFLTAPGTDAKCWMPVMSTDGRYVAYQYLGNGFTDQGWLGTHWKTALRDRQTGTTTCMDTQFGGSLAGDDDSRRPAISADGRFVAFESVADDLVPDDTNRWTEPMPTGGVINHGRDIFVTDATSGAVERVSVASDGHEGTGNGDCWNPSISGDGRFVVFSSSFEGLVPDDTNGHEDIFLHDRQTGETTRVSVAADGSQVNDGDSQNPVISADGKYVAFTSWATGFVPDQIYGDRALLVKELATGKVELLTVTPDGTQVQSVSTDWLAISGNGRYVAFGSEGAGLVAGLDTTQERTYVRDRWTGTTEIVSLDESGQPAGLVNSDPSISLDGRFVTFRCNSDVAESGEQYPDYQFGEIYLRDRLLQQTVRVSTGHPEVLDSTHGSLSGDGRLIVFASIEVYEPMGTVLVGTVTNNQYDLFVRTNDFADQGNDFGDIAWDDWAAPAILAVFGAGIVQGYFDDTYRPGNEVDRASMAVYLARAIAGGDDAVPDPNVTTPSFADVAEDHWAYKYIEYVASTEANVVQGYPGGNYQPDQVVNRGQMAVYIARAMVSPAGDAGVPDPPAGDPIFTDVTPTNEWAWCDKHVEYLADQGIVQGYADNGYHPANPVTRDQMAVYVARAFSLTP